MNKILVGCLILVGVGISFSQTKYNTREEKLQQLKTREDIKVTEVEKDLLKLEYPNGKVLYKNIGDYKPSSNNLQPTTYNPNFDSTIIDLTTIDTTLYYQKYNFWQEVLISNRKYPIIGDINRNGRVELYGFEKDYSTDYTGVKAKELNTNGSFDSLWYYENTTMARNIFDIDKDGNLELQLRREENDTTCDCATDKQLFFKKENDSSLATQLSFIMQKIDTGEAQYSPRFESLDGDEFIDYVYTSPPYLHVFDVYEYNPSTNHLEERLRYNYSQIDSWFDGFAIEDFDSDSYPEVILGGTYGQVIGFESSGDNQYNFILQDEVETNNAYMYAETNDNDGNGRKEFWIGGDAYFNGIPITRLTCFESIGDNVYEKVARIDLIGVFSFFAYNMKSVDVNKDGVDELMVCIDGNFLILAFNGYTNHHSYELYYIKQNELALKGENSVFWGATMSDLDYDGQEEVLIDMDHIKNSIGIRFFTSIYRPDTLTGIHNENFQVDEFKLEQNFPNPFNPSTQIKFSIPSNSLVNIKVYNILGKEVTVLLSENLPTGEHIIQWDGKDDRGNLLPGGVYFIQMIAGSYQKTIKTVLLK